MKVITNHLEIDEFINEKLKDDISLCITNTQTLKNLNFHSFSLIDNIHDCLNDKTKRFIKKNISDDDDTISCKSLETAVHQGFYFTIRDMYNDWLKDKKDYTIYERSAQWYYIREFCFGGMFRFGKDGKFNIPYGGAVYNNKIFGNKTKMLFTEETKQTINSATFKVCDFEEALKTVFNENDFIFLDPPYDSTFSEYDNNSFTREDHKRLHDILSKLKCRWLMAIGKTEFISDLYKDYEKVEYDKTYMYQARGTYDNKNTKHLIIKNF
jgi:DNA adenine methylase